MVEDELLIELVECHRGILPSHRSVASASRVDNPPAAAWHPL